MSEENEFIDWQGGECPVDQDMVVDAVFSDGSVTTNRWAGELDWQCTNHPGGILAYRVVEAPKPQVKIPKGFTPWAGGPCPVPVYVRVEVILRNGARDISCPAGVWHWHHGVDDGDGDIVAYRVIEGEKPKPQTARDTQVGGDHYKKAGVQPWGSGWRWPIDQQIGWYRGNALKYVMRMGTKDENLREIRKAVHYLQKLAEVLEQQGRA